MIYRNNLDSDTSEVSFHEGINIKLRLSGQQQYSEVYRFHKPNDMEKWLRVQANLTCIHKEWTPWRQTQFIVQRYQQGSVVQTNLIRVHRLLHDVELKSIYIDLLPEQDWDEAVFNFATLRVRKKL